MDKPAAGHLCALFTILVWGTTFVSTKVLLRTFAPAEILFCRFLLGYLALLLLRPRRLRTQRGQEILFAAAGLCGVTLYFLLENIALTVTSASNVGVIVAVSPLFTALLARRFLAGEDLSPRFFAGFAAAIGGVFLVSFSGSALRLSPAGDLLALLAAAVWAGYSVLMRKLGALGCDNVLCTRRVFFYGLLFMVPSLFLLDFQPSVDKFLTPGALPNLLYLGFGASALCFLTWNRAVGALGAVKTSAYIYLVPLITVAFSAVVLKEPVTPLMAAGMALTLAGLLLSEGRLPILKEREVVSRGGDGV